MVQVPVEELRPTRDPASFSFQTTAEVEPHVGLIGQDRAIEAIKFGLAIESKGFNICVAGEPGTGRTTAIREYLEVFAPGQAAAGRVVLRQQLPGPAPAARPALAAGPGRACSRARWRRWSPRPRSRSRARSRRTTSSTAATRSSRSVQRGTARRSSPSWPSRRAQAGFLLQGNPTGFFLVPLAGDKPMDDQAFAALTPGGARRELMQRRDELMEELRDADEAEAGRRDGGAEAADGAAADDRRPPSSTRCSSRLLRAITRTSRRSSQLPDGSAPRHDRAHRRLPAAAAAAGAGAAAVPDAADARRCASTRSTCWSIARDERCAASSSSPTRRRSACSAASRRKRCSAP